MDRQELKKNKLDLEYHHESQKANTFLILLTTGILGFLGSIILLDKIYFIFGFIAAILVAVLAGTAYRKSSRRMNKILYEIENLQ